MERNNCCPKCHFNLLAREGRFIFCLQNPCDWAIQKKRKTDEEIKEVHKIINDWK